MSYTVLAIALLGSCFLLHYFMMRKGGHSGHGDMEHREEENEKESHTKSHSGHNCCH